MREPTAVIIAALIGAFVALSGVALEGYSSSKVIEAERANVSAVIMSERANTTRTDRVRELSKFFAMSSPHRAGMRADQAENKLSLQHSPEFNDVYFVAALLELPSVQRSLCRVFAYAKYFREPGSDNIAADAANSYALGMTSSEMEALLNKYFESKEESSARMTALRNAREELLESARNVHGSE